MNGIKKLKMTDPTRRDVEIFQKHLTKVVVEERDLEKALKLIDLAGLDSGRGGRRRQRSRELETCYCQDEERGAGSCQGKRAGTYGVLMSLCGWRFWLRLVGTMISCYVITSETGPRCVCWPRVYVLNPQYPLSNQRAHVVVKSTIKRSHFRPARVLDTLRKQQGTRPKPQHGIPHIFWLPKPR